MSKPHIELVVNVWYGEGGAIHLSSDDPRLVDPASGKRKGLNMAISRSRQPKTYAMVDALLRKEDVQRR
jgi:hypothetical protein